MQPECAYAAETVGFQLQTAAALCRTSYEADEIAAISLILQREAVERPSLIFVLFVAVLYISMAATTLECDGGVWFIFYEHLSAKSVTLQFIPLAPPFGTHLMAVGFGAELVQM